MKKYWFRPKVYGYGMYPTTWQGFLATLLLLGLVLLSSYTNGFFEPTPTDESAWRFVIDTFLLIGTFINLFGGKVEGGLAWRWGK